MPAEVFDLFGLQFGVGLFEEKVAIRSEIVFSCFCGIGGRVPHLGFEEGERFRVLGFWGIEGCVIWMAVEGANRVS